MRSSFGRAILLVLALVAAAAGPASAQAPDIVLVNGKIVTVDDRFTIAQALAIKGERILKVGTTAEVESLRGPQTPDILSHIHNSEPTRRS
jgi:adenine deaminase